MSSSQTMTRRTVICAFLVGLILSGSTCGPRSPEAKQPELLVFAAASLSDVLREIGEVYKIQSATDLVFNFAGSNVLAQQILASPKPDVFVSANEEWMDLIEQAGQIEAEARRSLLSNRLVIIAHSDSSWEMDAAADMCRLDFRFLALGHPEAVPAGRYAKQWLETLACQNQSLWETVAERVSPAPDVRAVVGQVEATTSVLGIVYSTDYTMARDRVQLIFTVTADQGPPIRYEVSRLQNTKDPQAAESFVEFLFSDAAQTIFKKRGFLFLGDEP